MVRCEYILKTTVSKNSSGWERDTAAGSRSAFCQDKSPHVFFFKNLWRESFVALSSALLLFSSLSPSQPCRSLSLTPSLSVLHSVSFSLKGSLSPPLPPYHLHAHAQKHISDLGNLAKMLCD